MQLPTLVYNDDTTQPLGNLRPGRARADLEQWAGWIMETPVDTYVCHAAMPDICFFDSEVGEPFGGRVGQQWNSASLWMMAQSMAELRAEGTDPVRVQAEVVRAHGRRFLAAIRMSDAHYAWGAGFPADPLYPAFVHTNPQWRLRNPDGSLDVHMDYSHREVRSHRLGIMRELLEKYPVDGFELDFMRFCRHFPYPATPAQTELMTGFLRDLRALCTAAGEARGHPMTIGARLPALLAECEPHGLDPAAWAREGLLDYLSPCQWLHADFSIPVTDYLAAVRGTACRILFSIQPRVACTWAGGDCAEFDRAFPFGLAEFRALARTGYAAGAHGLHYFNVNCEFPGRKQEMQEMIRATSTPVAALSGPRHYQHLPADPADADCMSGVNRWQRMRFSEGAASPQTYHFQSGEEKRTSCRLAWRIFGAVPQDAWRFRLNGQEIREDEVTARWMGMGAAISRPGAALQPHMLFELSPAAPHELARCNRLEISAVHLQPGLPDREMSVLEVWAGS